MNLLVIIFILSVIGYYLVFMHFFKEYIGIFPLLFISGSVLIVFLHGCFEALVIGFCIVVLCGLACLIISTMMLLNKKFTISWRDIISPMFILMLIGGIWAWFLSRGIKPSHFDDFSHWLRICKIMNSDLEYPRYSDCVFPTYVPGTATWIFILTRVIGYSPENCYFAQMLLNLAAVCSLTIIIRSDDSLCKKTVFLIAIGVVSVFICDMDLTTYSLLVDGVLALTASALLVFILEIRQKVIKPKYWVPILVISSFVSLIKASGILFVLFNALAIYFLYATDKPKTKRVSWLYITPAVMILLGYMLQKLYLFRMKIVYGDDFVSQSFGSAELYTILLEYWEPERYVGIIKRFLHECFIIDEAYSQIKMLWFCLLLIWILNIVNIFKKRRDSLLICLGIYLPVISGVYLLGLMVTYFTFDPMEANENVLACFYRYVGSLTIMSVFASVYYLLSVLKSFEYNKLKDYIHFFIVIIAFIFTCFVAGFDPFYIAGFEYYHPLEVYTMDVWKYLETNYEERWEYNNDIYVIMVDVDNKGFDNYHKLSHALTTFFRSYYCVVQDIKDESPIIERIRQINDLGENNNVHFINYYD